MSYPAFERLAFVIQEYIYQHRWENLRPIQVEAIRAVFETDAHVLLASPTASGKTEAAFLPMITSLLEEPTASVGILYISPLKALINDQFLRLEALLEEADIPVTKWHGDVALSKKRKLLVTPKGVLQITPESLEAMLMKRKAECVRMFSDLRFIIIDEIHYFMNTSRGIQLLSILERISRITGNSPRRFGLSATLGDYHQAAMYLASGTTREVSILTSDRDNKKIRLLMEHFYIQKESEGKEHSEVSPYFEFLYRMTEHKKSIIFSNSKREVETNIAYLRRIAKMRNKKDCYFVHHGNISGTLREDAESTMKEDIEKVVTGATVTLELGIDIGPLERIVQTGSPLSVASFIQRLGRAGRRGDPSEMIFLFQEERVKEDVPFYRLMHFEFIMAIAIVELYIKERWIEPIRQRNYPYGILFHQTLSFLMTRGGIQPNRLAQEMLSITPFQKIGQDEYHTMLDAMCQDEIIEQIESGEILLGMKGEAIANNYEFYAVFDADIEYSVKCDSTEIGSISEPYPVGTAFTLAGNTWEVKEINYRQRIIYVVKIEGLSNINWLGKDKLLIHTKILKKMREVLLSLDNYSYLSEKAQIRLQQNRIIAKNSGFIKKRLVSLGANTYGFFPWLGTAASNALYYRLLEDFKKVEPIMELRIPIGFSFHSDKSMDEVRRLLESYSSVPIDKQVFPIKENDIGQVGGKYDLYIPKSLLKKQYLDEYVDVMDMQNHLFVDENKQ